ncbi:matrix metalloproteinase-20 [Brienomyrus brachyistius]|uniref:matrix metalloproteinase-20 n=1 Tax=Brienomyrus brachyistius TaxID=42636 RepID=UPI0020B3CBBD|nr:matrix metalloproteinase-20 [Brienomyrus brachyistius]
MNYLSLPWPWALVFVLSYSSRMVAAVEQSSDQETEPHRRAAARDLTLATEYLRRYYGLQTEPSWRRKRSDSSLGNRLRDMQRFFGLNATGSLDSETLGVMKAPRCGVPDVLDYTDKSGSRWTKRIISYNIGRYTSDIPPATVDRLIDSALNVWGRVSPLTFVRSLSREADIMVDFAAREHGDSYPFDGPLGTLAHAFGPGEGTGGDAHFDDDELWTAGSHGFNLYLVAAHEFGHSLGLGHSTNPESLMYPTYKRQNQHNLLSREDVVKINILYGTRGILPYYYSKTSLSPYYNIWNLVPRYPLLMQDKCNPNLSFDAVTSVGDANMFFKDSYLWIKYDQQCETKEGPVRNFIPKIDSNIDAAYSVPQRSLVYLFKASKFWTMKGSQVRKKPKSIYKFGISKEVERLDAAVHVNDTGHTLLFVKDMYWSYNENRRAMVDSKPRYISEDFPGINASISAAVYKDGFIHFFVGPVVFKYNYVQKQVVSVGKANSWLGC